MKIKLYPITALWLAFVLLSACNQGSKPVISNPAESVPIKKAPGDTLTAIKSNKIKFIDPVVLDIDSDYQIKLLDTLVTTEPGTPALDVVLINYWRNCYNDYHKLPAKIIIKYATPAVKAQIAKNVIMAVNTAQESVREYIHGKDEDKMVKYPILYQQRF